MANDTSGIVFCAAVFTQLLTTVAATVASAFKAGITVLTDFYTIFADPTGVATHTADDAHRLADRAKLQAILTGHATIAAGIADHTHLTAVIAEFHHVLTDVAVFLFRMDFRGLHQDHQCEHSNEHEAQV